MTHLIQKILENNPSKDIVVANGFETAIIGYDKFSNNVVYSLKKCMDILMEDRDMEIDEAECYIHLLAAHKGAIYMKDINDILNINLN